MSGGAARNNCVPTTLAPALSADAPSIKPVRGGEWKGPNENPFAPALRLLNSAAVLPCARTPDVIKKVSWAPGTKEGSVGRRRGCRRLSPLARSPEDVEKKEYWDDINRLNSEVKNTSEYRRDVDWALRSDRVARLGPNLPAWLDEHGFHGIAHWLRASSITSLLALQAIPFRKLTDRIAELPSCEEQLAAQDALAELARIFRAQWLRRSERRELRQFVEW